MDLATLARRYDNLRDEAENLNGDRFALYVQAVGLYDAKQASATEIAGALGVSEQRWWQILRQVRDSRQDA